MAFATAGEKFLDRRGLIGTERDRLAVPNAFSPQTGFSSNQSARSTIVDHQHINCSMRDLGNNNNQALFNQSNYNWGNYSIADNGHRYVVSYESPWQTPAVSVPDGRNLIWEHYCFINAAGYDFSSDMIKTQSKIRVAVISIQQTRQRWICPE